MANRHFWLFRTLDNQYCLENNTVNYGWSDIKIHEYQGYDIEGLRAEAFHNYAPQVYNCLQIQKGDILIMPLKWEGGIAIGEVLSDHILHNESEELYEKDMSNYFEVKWLTKYYDRTDLPAEIQSTLKYQRANLNIDYYRDKFENIIKELNRGIDDDEQSFGLHIVEQRKKDVKIIFKIISNRQAKMSDNDFEKFILEFFCSTFNLVGIKNTVTEEANDGKDIMLSYKHFQPLGIEALSWNVQIKQHVGETDSWAVEQISKSDNLKPFVLNVVVSTATFNEDAVKLAKEKNVILIDGIKLAEIIYDNFNKISSRYKRKLGLVISMTQL